MLKTSCAIIALFAVAVSTDPAWAACAGPADVAALKTAVLQQELMVAAFQCHEAGAYNHFVNSYRSELQASDAALKSFFVKRGGEHGEAGYDTFKTKAANLSGLEQARNTRAFCADAHALFAAAARNDGTLAQFVEARSTPLDVGGVCQESRPVLAAAKPASPAPVRVADAVGGVPDHALPMHPWRSQDMQDAPPPPMADAPPPPPRARAYQVRDQEQDYAQNEQDNYAPPPPPNWRRMAWRDVPPPPRYRWYPQDSYYGR